MTELLLWKFLYFYHMKDWSLYSLGQNSLTFLIIFNCLLMITLPFTWYYLTEDFWALNERMKGYNGEALGIDKQKCKNNGSHSAILKQKHHWFSKGDPQHLGDELFFLIIFWDKKCASNWLSSSFCACCIFLNTITPGSPKVVAKGKISSCSMAEYYCTVNTWNIFFFHTSTDFLHFFTVVTNAAMYSK